MDKQKHTNENSWIEQAAINIVDTERNNWETALCYVTEAVAFQMRQLIRVLRKNYWGVFDDPMDPNTGREKIWIHLAMKVVEDITKNIDLDTKDVNFIAKTENGYEITELVRSIVKEYLNQTYFGETLDETERQLCIDGTVVWKTWKEGKDVRRSTVDLLNIYIDPTEDNIQKAFRFTERSVTTPDQLLKMTGWENTKGIIGSQNINKNDGFKVGSTSVPTTGNFVDVWECWGKIPKPLVDKDREAYEAGDYEMIDGHIVVSGLQSGDIRCHLVEENTNKDADNNVIKPYEEVRIAKVAGRWYGLGFIERILALQEYLNTTMNIRINRATISQLGLFKIRKGQGITAQMLAKLPSNGALVVNQMDDIEQMAVQPVDQSSYKDEETIKEWASAITQSFPVSTGENLPSSTSATAVAVQAQSSKTAYGMTKDAIGMFIERWINRHLLPKLAPTISKKDIVRVTGDDERFRELVENVAIELAWKELDKSNEKGYVPSEEELQKSIDNSKEKMLKKQSLFVEVVQDIVAKNVETKVLITNEDIDTSVTIQNLLQMMNIAPEYKEAITKEVFNLMGIDMPRLPKTNPMEQGTQSPQDMMAQLGGQAPTQQTELTGAVTQQ